MSGSTLLAYSPVGPERRPRGAIVRGVRWLGSGLWWIFASIVVIGGITFAIQATVNGLLGPFTPVGATLLLVAGAMLARGVRRARDLSVLHYLEHAIQLNAPLPAMLAAAERSERGAVRERLRRLRMRLEAGDAIALALTIATPALPRRITALVAAGESTGRLAAALRRVTAQRDFFPQFEPARAIFFRWYPLVLLVFCFGVVEALLLFVIPKYTRFTKEMGVAPPGMAFLDLSFERVAMIVVPILGAVVLLFCARMTSQLFTPHGFALGPLRRPADLLVWYTPIAGGVFRNRATADACHVIANALDAGLSINHAIVEAATNSANWMMERRLRNWARRTLAGADLATAARSAHLPSVLCGMLATAPGEMQEVFAFLCRYYDGQFSRAITLLRGALIPAIAIGFGIIVAAIALNVFQPLVDVINKLTRR